MKRKPSCTVAVTDSLVPAETTPTTSELRSGAVRTFKLAVVYLLPTTFNAGVGTGSRLMAATGLEVDLAFGLGLTFVRVGLGLAVGLGVLVRRTADSRTGVGIGMSSAGRSIAGAG
jgi:hypothetical protein